MLHAHLSRAPARWPHLRRYRAGVRGGGRGGGGDGGRCRVPRFLTAASHLGDKWIAGRPENGAIFESYCQRVSRGGSGCLLYSANPDLKSPARLRVSWIIPATLKLWELNNILSLRKILPSRFPSGSIFTPLPCSCSTQPGRKGRATRGGASERGATLLPRQCRPRTRGRGYPTPHRGIPHCLPRA